MTREEAIDNLSVAFGECRDAIRRQAEAIRQVADDMDKLNEALRKVKALAKSLPRQPANHRYLPTRKFNKMRK